MINAVLYLISIILGICVILIISYCGKTINNSYSDFITNPSSWELDALFVLIILITVFLFITFLYNQYALRKSRIQLHEQIDSYILSQKQHKGGEKIVKA